MVAENYPTCCQLMPCFAQLTPMNIILRKCNVGRLKMKVIVKWDNGQQEEFVADAVAVVSRDNGDTYDVQWRHDNLPIAYICACAFIAIRHLFSIATKEDET